MKYFLILLTLIETTSFAENFHFDASLFKDHSRASDFSFSYDILPSDKGGLELSLGMTSKEYETETSKESLLGGFVGTNITQTVSDSLLTSYKLRIGSEVDSKVYDPYFENRLGLILTSKLPVSSRGAEFGIGWKVYFKEASTADYREESIYVYPYVGISL